jgi:hypothetical protein
MLTGYLLRYFSKALYLPENTHQGVNVFVLYLSLPAMALYYVPKIHFSWQVLLPLSLGLMILLGALAFFTLCQKLLKYNRSVLGALVLSCGFGNISFLGYPLVEAYYGKEGLKTAVLIDQGTFFVLALLGIPLAVFFAGGQNSAKLVLRKLLLFPSFGAFLIGLLLAIFGRDFPESMQLALKRFADTLTPLALFSVGWQMQFKNLQIKWQYYSLGFFYKLFLAPFVLYVALGNDFTLSEKVVVLQSAMPPMITSSLIAAEQGLEPPLTNFLVPVGILISLISTWLWYICL